MQLQLYCMKNYSKLQLVTPLLNDAELGAK